MDYKKILVPIDGSDESLRALSEAVYLSKLSNAEITLLTIIDTKDGAPSPEMEAAGKTLLDECAKTVKDEVKISTEVRCASPSEAIISAAEEEGFDLVIMGSRGLSPFETMLIGGVSNGVIQGLKTCPVMIVR